MLSPRTEGTIPLSDGRSLGYAEFGDPDGPPVMFLHGLPSSRLSAGMLHHAAERRGIRLISPDRPGFGLSDDAPDRTILDWPRDAAELADGLGIERFGVMGVSGAMPYVCASTILTPERLTGAAIVSGLGPLNVPGVLDGMNRESRTLYRMALKSPRFGRIWMRMLSTAAKRSPALVFRQQMDYLPDVDRELFSAPEMRDLRMRDLAEAFRQGSAAAAREAELHVNDWGFALDDVEMEVTLWHGELDRHHPTVMAEYLATALPSSRRIVVRGAGAFGFIEHIDEVFDALLPDEHEDGLAVSGSVVLPR